MTITPSNLVMGSIPNTTTAMAGPFTSTAKTPKGLLSSKVDQQKLYTPVAYSPISNNKNHNSNSKSKKNIFTKTSPINIKAATDSNKVIEEPAYYPGMLKVSPNSGFTQFKKP